MRWTDLPVAQPVQPLATWRDAMFARAPGARRTVETLARRACAGSECPLVLIDATAVDTALHHVRGSALERGGLLVGTPVALGDAAEPIALVHVTAAVCGSESAATPLSLRLGTEIWTRANVHVRAGETIVGWFHSHPGIGAFFSATDRRTQAAFFTQPYSLGWVIDPVRGEDAFFLGSQARLVPRSAITLA